MQIRTNLKRFIDAQENTYAIAFSEIRAGKKRTHWMWYIFPQIQGLGASNTSRHYAIENLEEASAFLQHPVLGSRLLEITNALNNLDNCDAGKIFGYPDDLKLKSCMTLFSAIPGAYPVFQQVLDKFFAGTKDQKTLQIISR